MRKFINPIQIFEKKQGTLDRLRGEAEGERKE